MGDGAQIYLSKPGGQRQGPFTLAQIKHSVAANVYRDSDYWAWHEGLPDWVPLYDLPGLSENGAPPPPVPSAPPQTSAPAPVPTAPVPAPGPEEVPLPPEVASGLPFSALEHIFLFATSDGPAAWQSPEVGGMLESIIGVELDLIRQNVQRDVVGRCNASGLLKPDGSISDAVWRAMTSYQPELVRQARKRLHRVCVRTFRTGPEGVAILILFYNKEKL